MRGLVAAIKENATRLLFRQVELFEKVMLYMFKSVSGAKKCRVMSGARTHGGKTGGHPANHSTH